MNKAHLTAIARKTASAPMKWLHEHGKLLGKKLDYGCGRGLDADIFGCEKYDPHYFKCDDFTPGEFQTITCNFVLNVIPDEQERQAVLERIEHWLAPGGVAYITIRSDVKKLGGYTRRGTWQGYVPPKLPLLHRGHGFETYIMTKGA
jgi:hypothetical protein